MASSHLDPKHIDPFPPAGLRATSADFRRLPRPPDTSAATRQAAQAFSNMRERTILFDRRDS